ncbi:MAG: MFS transporter [Azoarcus sp.]|jgi:MFS family permease|nr:MFS transporter [Azoarcus sp.]
MSTAQRRRFLLPGLILLAAFAGLGIGIARVATALYSVELRASEFELGLIAAAQGVGILFTSLPTGILVQRHGPFLPLCVGSLLCGLAYCLTPAVPTVWFLLAATAFVSFVMPLRFVSLNTVFLQQIEFVGAARAGWFRGAHMTGFLLIGPLLGVLLLERLGFTGAYLAIGATFFAALAVTPIAVERRRAMAQGTGPRPALNWREVGAQLRLLASEPELRRTSLFEFFTQAVSAFFSFFIVIIALRDYGFSEHKAALLLTFEGALFVASLFLAGVLLARWGMKRFYLASFAVLAIALLLLSRQWGAPLLWLASGLLGIGLGTVYIGNFMTYARIGERLGMGRISGLSGLVGPSGGFFGSLLGGSAGGLWSLQAIFLPMGAICLLFLWQVFRLEKRPAEADAAAVAVAEISRFKEEGAA